LVVNFLVGCFMTRDLTEENDSSREITIHVNQVVLYSVRGLERSELGSHEIRPIHSAPNLGQSIGEFSTIGLGHII